MTWVTLDANDKIQDKYEDDGTKTVVVTYNNTEYISTNATVLEGSEAAKSAKASGGSEVTIEADLDDASESIKGIRYSISG